MKIEDASTIQIFNYFFANPERTFEESSVLIDALGNIKGDTKLLQAVIQETKIDPAKKG